MFYVLFFSRRRVLGFGSKDKEKTIALNNELKLGSSRRGSDRPNRYKYHLDLADLNDLMRV